MVISAANRKNAPEKGLESAGFTDINSANIFKSYARRWSFFLRLRNGCRAPGVAADAGVLSQIIWNIFLNNLDGF